MTATPAGYVAAVLADSPLGFWPIDEGASDPVDAASGHDATWNGSHTGVYGPACQTAAELTPGTYADFTDTSALYVPSSGSWHDKLDEVYDFDVLETWLAEALPASTWRPQIITV